MKLGIFARFLGLRYCVALVAFFLLFSSLFLLVELFEMRDYMDDIQTMASLVRYLVLRFPFLAYFSAPIAALVSALFVAAWRSHVNELVAAQSCGISVSQILFPFFAAGLGLAVVMAAGTEWKVPDFADEADRIKTIELKKLSPPERDFHDVAFAAGDRYVLAERFAPDHLLMEGVKMIKPNASRTRIEELKQYPYLVYREQNLWYSPTGDSLALLPPELISLVAASAGFRPLVDRPVEAVKLSSLVMDYFMLKNLLPFSPNVEKLQKEIAKRVARIQIKISFPVVIPLLTMLGALLGMIAGHRHGVAYATSVAFVATLGFMLLMETSVKTAEFAAATGDIRWMAPFIPWLTPAIIALILWQGIKET